MGQIGTLTRNYTEPSIPDYLIKALPSLKESLRKRKTNIPFMQLGSSPELLQPENQV